MSAEAKRRGDEQSATMDDDEMTAIRQLDEPGGEANRFGISTGQRWLGWWLATVVVAAGCATAPDEEPVATYQWEEADRSTQQFEAWLDGAEAELEDLESADELLWAAEASYWSGDWEAAYDDYVEMLVAHPGHALNRYAAARLVRLRGDVIDFSSRVAEDLADIRYDRESALTRIELARLGYRVERDRWERSESEQPFSFRGAGVFDRWRATPALSPWRLLDFEVPMEPQKQPRLAERYRSPVVAADDEANRQPTITVFNDGLRDRLGLGSSGVYYLESQWTVEGDEPREFTLSGRFPGAARVWIDGQEIFERTENGYETGRLVRRAMVEPGQHRVLVKMAYQPGSRDWMELLAVPVTGPVFGDAAVDIEPEVGATGAGVEVSASQQKVKQLEPVAVDAADASEVDAASLYLAVVSTYSSGDSESFTRLWDELMERHPEFVPGYLLASYQAQTRWDLPASSRDSATASYLRQAEELAPDHLYVLVELERRLRHDIADGERRRLLERARQLAVAEKAAESAGASPEYEAVAQDVGSARFDDATAVRQLRPLRSWARYLDNQGWSGEAEQAWRQILAIDPRDCEAMRNLKQSYRSRNHFVEPEELSEHWQACSSVVQTWLRDHPERIDEWSDEAGRRARRHPWDASRQRVYADALGAAGDAEGAAAVLDEALERMPWERRLWNARIERAIADGDEELARQLLDEATDKLGRSSQWDWKNVRLGGEVPLLELMKDGRHAAADEVRRTGVEEDVDEQQLGDDRAMVLDDAYYVVDFAARKYFDDGSAWTLTHQITRVMTRGAINDYAELSVPRGAHLLVARTIKEDGEVRVPEGVSGDSTLSMPGLAEGDMVEVAYLEFDSPGRFASHLDGGRFFFRMSNISSRHSEYLVIGTEDMEFERANEAPEPETLQWRGRKAHRFVAENTRRPRSEPRRVSALEYLPWVRAVRSDVDAEHIEGVLDMERRYMKESIRSSARRAPVVDDKLEEWLGRPIDGVSMTDRDIRALFYGAADWFRTISAGAFSTEAAHAIERRRGSPLIPMHIALSEAEVDHDIYIARTDEEPLIDESVGAISRYREPLIRVVMPDSGQVKWLQLERRDAMFGAVEPEIDGQEAICVTCPKLERHTVTMNDELRPRRHVDVDASLDEAGTLSGTLDYRFDGVRAARVRGALRGRRDEDDRRSYFEQVLTGQLSGADLEGYEVVGEDEPDEPLRFTIEFERPDFARSSDDGLVVDRPLFREAMQRIYARPSSRTTAMFVGYERVQGYSVELELPDDTEATDLRATDVDDAHTEFGDYERRSRVEDGTFYMESAIRLPRQRIQPEDYAEFRDWTRTVEESGGLWLEIELGGQAPEVADEQHL